MTLPLRSISLHLSLSLPPHFHSDDSLVHLAGIFHNLYLKIQEREPELYQGDSGWKFYIHNPKEVPTLGVQTHGTSLYPGQGRDLRLDLKKARECQHI